MKVDKIIFSIEDAIQKECFLPALALTLVLPDICARFDYPNIYYKKEKYNERSGQGAAYSKWYDKNIGDYDIEPLSKIKMLDGRSCWKLRCGFLHDVSIDIDKEISGEEEHVYFKMISSSGSNFKGTLGGVSSIVCSTTETGKQVPICIEFDIANFCGQILAVLKNKYMNNQDFLKSSENKGLNYIERSW